MKVGVRMHLVSKKGHIAWIVSHHHFPRLISHLGLILHTVLGTSNPKRKTLTTPPPSLPLYFLPHFFSDSIRIPSPRLCQRPPPLPSLQLRPRPLPASCCEQSSRIAPRGTAAWTARNREDNHSGGGTHTLDQLKVYTYLHTHKYFYIYILLCILLYIPYILLYILLYIPYILLYRCILPYVYTVCKCCMLKCIEVYMFWEAVSVFRDVSVYGCILTRSNTWLNVSI